MNTKKTLFTSAGVKVHYWTQGTADQPTIVMVHGFTGTHDGFQYIAPLLKDYHVIIPDLPGFGVSPLTAEAWTIDGLGKLLTQFIDALKLEARPFIVAHSMGTLIAAAALRQAPDIAQRKVVLISPIPTPIRPLEVRWPGKLLGQLQYDASQHVPGLGKRIAHSRLISRIATKLIMTTSDKMLKKKIYQHHFDNLNFISSIPFYNTLYREMNRSGVIDFADYLAPFEILIINGNNDKATPLREQKRLAAALHAELHIIPDVGHLAHYETPAAIVDEMTRFLQ